MKETINQNDKKNGIKMMRDKVLLILKKNQDQKAEIPDNSTYKKITDEIPKEIEEPNTFKPNPDPSTSETERMSELEKHVIELHKEFDKFVLDSDKFLNQERFMELRHDYDDRLKTLDSLETALDESKKEILKDATYMDEIVQGFSYVKNKIDMLEKRINENENTKKNTIIQDNKGPDEYQEIRKEISEIKSTLEMSLKAMRDTNNALAQEIYGIKRDMESIKAMNLKDAALEETTRINRSKDTSEISDNIDKLKGLCNQI